MKEITRLATFLGVSSETASMVATATQFNAMKERKSKQANEWTAGVGCDDLTSHLYRQGTK